MKLFLLVLNISSFIVCVGLIGLLQNRVKVLENHPTANEVIKYHNRNFYLYGMQGQGYVRDQYPVHTPVYMEEYDRMLLQDEVRSETIKNKFPIGPVKARNRKNVLRS